VVDHQGPIRAAPHIQLDTIGTDCDCFGEGRHRIFGNALVKSTVGEDLSHLPTLPEEPTSRGDFLPVTTIFPGQSVLEKILIYPLKFEHPRRSLVIPLPEH